VNGYDPHAPRSQAAALPHSQRQRFAAQGERESAESADELAADKNAGHKNRLKTGLIRTAIFCHLFYHTDSLFIGVD
jgi:hypothetical protein